MKIQDSISNEFDAFSKNYTNDMIGVVPYYLELMSCFTKSLPNSFNPKTILDVGCGNGNVTASLLKSFPNAEYTLLDASQEMLNLCAKRFKNSAVSCVKSYFQEFTFKANTYNLIVAGFSLHHCNSEDKKSIFKKIYKALKKEGVFMCSDLMISKNNPAHSSLVEKWHTFVLNTFPDGEKWQWLMDHYTEFDKPDNLDEQLRWLKSAGFSSIETTIHEKYWAHFKAIKN
tara:strand:+ start:173193 stop:173879 length:687 start_codon:yes stop_codon:yes gene_type:complete